MGHVVVSVDAEPDPQVVAELASYGVSTVHEAQGRTGLLASYLRPIIPGRRIAGRAVTVSSHPGDNLMIHVAVEQVLPGDILVVTTTSPSTDGMFGELLATSLRAHGCIGLVIEAGVRDVAELTAMDFPVWSRAISAQGTVKASPGSVNIPITIAGAHVCPGDVVVCDDDGVVVVAGNRAAEVATASAARIEKEEANRAELATGRLGLDLFGLRDRLPALGIKYVHSGSEKADRRSR